MTMNENERQLREFVLRKLADEDRERLEEALFADDEMFERLVEAEYDLIDEWGSGSLSPDERRDVESVIGRSPMGAERLRMSRTLGTLASRSGVVPLESYRRRSATWVPIAAAAGVAAVVAGLWFASSQATNPSLTPVQVAEQPVVAPLEQPVTPPVQQPAPVQIAETPEPVETPVATPAPSRDPLVFALSLATLRSEAVEPVLAVSESRPVQIRVALDPADRFDGYSATITGPTGDLVHEAAEIRPVDQNGTLSVAFTVPAGELTEGLHEVAVQADGMDLGFVTFRVDKN